MLVAEQGLGDTLMFCRLGITVEQELSIPVTLFCQKQLVSLLQQGSGLSHVTAEAKASLMQAKDTLWCPLMSLSERMHLNPTHMDIQIPYLQIDPQHVRSWSNRLQRRGGHRLIALHWQGNPRHEDSL